MLTNHGVGGVAAKSQQDRADAAIARNDCQPDCQPKSGGQGGRPRLTKLLISLRELVGVTGFEPATLCPPDKCATRLRYTPTEAKPYTARGFEASAILGPDVNKRGFYQLRGPSRRKVPAKSTVDVLGSFRLESQRVNSQGGRAQDRQRLASLIVAGKTPHRQSERWSSVANHKRAGWGQTWHPAGLQLDRSCCGESWTTNR